MLLGGTGLYVLVMWDVFATTLSMHGGGPITTRLTDAVDAILAGPPAKLGEDTQSAPVAWFFARYSNLLLTTSLFFTWVTGLLLAPTLVLASVSDSLAGGPPEGASFVDRLYFVGAALTTAGFGQWRAAGGVWQVVTVVVAVSGIVVTSLGIAYVINLVSAVTAQRRIARTITNLGNCPRDILSAHYDGEGFARFAGNCSALATALLGHTQRHLAYPMVHYVRASDNRDCLPAAVALLDETVSVLLFNLPAHVRPEGHALVTVRRAVSTYLESLRDIYLSDDRPDVPPWPDVSWTRDLWDIPAEHRERELNAGDSAALTERRILLRAAVQSQGLAWETYYEAIRHDPDEPLDAELMSLLAEGRVPTR